jgi:hypothetical protein
MPAVVIELHFEPIGSHLRLLPRRFSRRAKRPATKSEHVSSAHQRKPEHGERNGDGQRPAHKKETGNRECGYASCLADDRGKLARVCSHKVAASDEEKQKNRTTGKKVCHRQVPF